VSAFVADYCGPKLYQWEAGQEAYLSMDSATKTLTMLYTEDLQLAAETQPVIAYL